MIPRRRPSTVRPAHWVWALRLRERHLAGALARRIRRGEDGFTLLEMIISIVIITIIMSALTSVYVNTLSSMSSLRADQAAAQISTDAIDNARSVGATEAVAGRGSTAVANQFAAAPAAVQSWLTGMDQASDSQASPTAGADATLPTTASTQIVNNVTYSINYYVGTCHRIQEAAQNDDPCITAAAANADTTHHYVTYARVVAAVTWSGQRCAAGACSHVAAVLLNGDPDPIFNLNTDPPPPPKLTGCLSPHSAAKDVFGTKDADGNVTPPGAYFLETAATSTDEIGLCTLTDGVPPFTYALTDSAGHPLPQGLSLGVTGVICGTVAGDPKTYSGIQITVTDAFLRQSTSNAFNWQVVGPLVIAPVADQVSIVGTPITPLTLTATGGYATPYTWSATGLPDGVALDPATGALSGTPTSAGANHVTVTVKDADPDRTRTASVDFTWTVYDPLAINGFGNQASSVGDAVDLPIDVSGGSGSYTLVASGLPGGLTLIGDSSSGYHITGTVAAGGASAVTLTATDAVTAVPPVAVNAEWVVADGGPAIADPGDQTNRVGDHVSLEIAAACGPNTPCSWSGGGALPPGISFNSASGTFEGTPTTSGTYPGIYVAYTDSEGQSASATFSWTITPPLAITIGNQRTAVGKTATAATPTLTGSIPGATYTFSAATTLSGADGIVANDLPQGLSIDPTTGTISGTPTSAGIYNVTLTATSPTDSPASTTFTWYVLGLKTIPDQGCYVSTGAGTKCSGSGTSSSPWSQSLTTLVGYAVGRTPSATIASASISGGASGSNPSATASGTTLTVKASKAGTFTVTVNITDSGDNAPSATVATSFTWTITAAPLAIAVDDKQTVQQNYDSLDLSDGASGGQPPYTYTVANKPSWLTLSGSTLSGTAPKYKTSWGATNSWTMTVTVKDSAGKTASDNFTWRVTKN